MLAVGLAVLEGFHAFGDMSGIEARSRLLVNSIWIVSIVPGWLYFACFESSAWQATPGKRMLRIQVTNEHFERIGFAQATLRYVCKLVSAIIVGMGFVITLFTEKHQALHDMIAKSFVVRSEQTTIN